jgi:hypothetical protein
MPLFSLIISDYFSYAATPLLMPCIDYYAIIDIAADTP